MGEMQPVEFRMPHQTRTAAALAAPRVARLKRHAVAAKTVLRIVDSHRYRCEHKENIANLIPARRREQGGAGGGAMAVAISPLTADLWPAFENLFGKQGACYGC